MKQLFNINTDFFLSLPCSIYCKDFEGYCLNANDFLANSLGVRKGKDLIGRHDSEFCTLEEAKIIHENDKNIIINFKPQMIIEKFTLENKNSHQVLTYKLPLLTLSGELVGIFGLPFDLNLSFNLPHLFKETLSQYSSSLSSSLFPFQRENLSKRELECLYYLAHGMTAKMIAEKLHLSCRTIESYLEGLKNKLGCFKKAELIDKAIKAGILNDSLENLIIKAALKDNK